MRDKIAEIITLQIMECGASREVANILSKDATDAILALGVDKSLCQIRCFLPDDCDDYHDCDEGCPHSNPATILDLIGG